jgi:hypothetical protein
MGLSASAIADVLITASIFALLRRGRNGVKRWSTVPAFGAAYQELKLLIICCVIRTDYILDTLIRHSVENGALTGAGTIASLICVSLNHFSRIYVP